jgi:hypothetical protein
MAAKRLPKERVFTPKDVEKAAHDGKVYDRSLVDFLPFEPDAELAELLKGAG